MSSVLGVQQLSFLQKNRAKSSLQAPNTTVVANHGHSMSRISNDEREEDEYEEEDDEKS
jgi:hypothetical protein